MERGREIVFPGGKAGEEPQKAATQIQSTLVFPVISRFLSLPLDPGASCARGHFHRDLPRGARSSILR